MLRAGKPVLIIYALLMLGGGIAGYATKGSIMSLASGIISAILLGVGYSMIASKPQTGYGISLFTAAVLTLVFIERTMKTASEPSGMKRNIGLAVLSIVVACLFGKCMSDSS